MQIETSVYQEFLRLMPIICVDSVILHDGAALLVKRRNSPAKGQWWFPGGRLLKGEEIANAAVRKAFSEVGLRCRFRSIKGVEETYFQQQDDMNYDVHTINITVLLDLVGDPVATLDCDHDDVAWVTRNSDFYHGSIQRTLTDLGFRFG